MKQNSLKVFFIFAVLLLSAISLQAETREKKPVIGAEEKFWDFGYVPFDYELVHYYEIKNTGDDNLYINQIGTSCDCTYARALDTLIPPGGSSEIKVSFKTTNYYGKNTRTVAIHSNDPENPVYDLEFLSLIGAIPKYVEAVPNALFFLPPHKEKEIKLLNKTDRAVNVAMTLEPDSVFSIDKTVAEIPAGGYAIIKVTPREGLGQGTFQSSFTVDFIAESRVRITVPVKIVRY